jgi:DNA repair ATPase RecN
MAPKPIAIVDQDSDLQELDKKLEKAHAEFEEGNKFLDKQRQDLFKKTVEPVWEEIKEHLISNGQLESFDGETQSLSIRGGIIFISEKGESGIPQELASFLSHMLSPPTKPKK